MSLEKSLFNVQIGEITIEDINEFCDQKLPEGSIIDYKEALSLEKIGHTIAAMANSDGGLILIGVPESKIDLKSYPEMPKGIPVQRGSSIKQQIANWCCAYLQPIYCPEIREIPMTDTDKCVVLIRIDKDRVPSIPVFCRDKGIMIRLDKENRLADPLHIRILFKEDEKLQRQIDATTSVWLRDKLPTLDGFCWCSVFVRLPMRRFADKLTWNSEQISRLRTAVESHQIGGTYTWAARYHPEFRRLQNAREYISFRRSVNTVRFYPVPQPQRGKKWFNIWFDSRGYILASVGFPDDQEDLTVELIASSFYVALDLFTKEEVKSCYPDSLWEAGKFQLFYQVSRFPGQIRTTALLNSEPPDDFPAKGSSIGGPHETESFESLDAEVLTKRFVGSFLAAIGFYDYEKPLESFNIKDQLW